MRSGLLPSLPSRQDPSGDQDLRSRQDGGCNRHRARPRHRALQPEVRAGLGSTDPQVPGMGGGDGAAGGWWRAQYSSDPGVSGWARDPQRGASGKLHRSWAPAGCVINPSFAELLGSEEGLGSQPALQQADSDYARVHACVCVTCEYTSV